MKNKWMCDWCMEKFKLKKELVEHLRAELDEANMYADTVMLQLEDMGVKKLYEE